MVLKVYRFHKRAFLLTVHGVNVSIDANVALAKQKQTKLVFSTEDLVLIKVLCQVKGYDN